VQEWDMSLRDGLEWKALHPRRMSQTMLREWRVSNELQRRVELPM